MLKHKTTLDRGDKRNQSIGWMEIAVSILPVLALVVVVAEFLPKDRAAANETWLSPHFQDHPLAGTIWTSDSQSITIGELETALSNARFVLLGEIHNNPDHHRLQAQLIADLVRKGQRPAIVFEMVATDMQPILDRYRKRGAGDSAKLGKDLQWEQRGWPEWSMYAPIAETALSAALPMLAGGLGTDAQQALAWGETNPIFERTVRELDIASPLRPEIAEAEGAEVKEAHCNLLPATALESMVRIQRARDAYLAQVMMSTKADEGAVLIAGAGHARKDWAVPAIIRAKLPDARVVSVAFVEVDPDRSSPADYMQAVPGLKKPFDFIYLTPRADLTDQCAEIEKHLKSHKSEKSR